MVQSGNGIRRRRPSSATISRRTRTPARPPIGRTNYYRTDPKAAMGVFDRFRLDGRRALITGGSRGLGLAMATALAEAGADLVIVGRDAAHLAEAAGQLARFGREVRTLTADVGVPDEAETMCATVLGEIGRVDVLINNVGGRRIDIPTEQLPLEEWRRILDLNLTSAFVCCKRLGGAMVQRKSGVILNVTSIAGIIVNKGIFGRSYETAKAALGAFTKTLAVDWAPHNVRVNALAP